VLAVTSTVWLSGCDDQTPQMSTGTVNVVPVADVQPTANVADVQPLTMDVGAQESNGHTFTYRDNPNANSVHVAGTFNGWSSVANPMTRAADGSWSVTLPLDEGVHHYKFVVNGDQWITDPAGDPDFFEPDNYGGQNSGVLVGPDGRKLPAPQPDAILSAVIRHEPTDLQDVNVVSKNLLRLGIRVQESDVSEVSVVFRTPGENAAWKTQRLSSVQSRFGFERFGGMISADASPVSYFFKLRDGNNVVYHHATGITPDQSAAEVGAFVNSMQPAFETPDWAKSAVWYQIFPERFRNGDASNDPNDQKFERLISWTSDWWKNQPGETPGEDNFYKGAGNVWQRRYGGDIQGLQQQLPYLRSLGVTAIYLNPMFEAESMHKYDTADFRHIDDNFGIKGDLKDLSGETDDPATWKWSKSDLLFLDFVAEAHKQGFKVVLDGVFNHVGRAHPFFQDVVEKGPASKYASWFEIEDFGNTIPADPEMFGKDGGLKFKAWDQPSGHLPAFRKNAERGLAEGPYEHVMAITRRWLAPDGDPSRGIDGWRLDVANDIPHPFWIEWRKTVKQTKPDAYICGEIWTWAQPWLKGDQFDAVMNYQFAMPAQNFFVDQRDAIKPSEFLSRLSRVAYAYPYQVSLAQMNLFDSHDTDRLASMFVNPDRPYDGANRIQDNGPDYSGAKPTETQWQRMKQAVATQMMFVGAPMTYYGNENGMWSPDDPNNRQPMVWKDLGTYENPEIEFRQSLFDFFQRVIAIRRELPALNLGYFRPVLSDDDAGIAVFARDHNGQSVYVVINRSDTEATVGVPVDQQDGVAFHNWLDPQQTDVVQPKVDATDARPTIIVKPDARSHLSSGGKVGITLPAYGTAVLVQK